MCCTLLASARRSRSAEELELTSSDGETCSTCAPSPAAEAEEDEGNTACEPSLAASAVVGDVRAAGGVPTRAAAEDREVSPA